VSPFTQEGGEAMTETRAARDLRLATNSTPPVEIGWTLDRDGRVVSNGCQCMFKDGEWLRRGCEIHKAVTA